LILLCDLRRDRMQRLCARAQLASEPNGPMLPT
jgi:hypothetical protein